MHLLFKYMVRLEFQSKKLLFKLYNIMKLFENYFLDNIKSIWYNIIF